MQSVFGLFRTYDQARAAVRELLDKQFPEQCVNIIVQDHVAKGHIAVPWDRINVAVTEMEPGLDRIVGRQQSVSLPDVGEVFAAGELGTELAKVGSMAGGGGTGLETALRDFEVPEQIAGAYTKGIRSGGVLCCLRVGDERAAEAANVLWASKADHVAAYPGD